MKRTTREWVRKAEADHLAAQKLFHSATPLHDQSCFFCEQSAEKYLKALLEELGLAIPRTHILKDLLALLLPQHPSLKHLRIVLTPLTRFAVGTCYPGRQRDEAPGNVRSAVRRQGAHRLPSSTWIAAATAAAVEVVELTGS